MPQSKDLLLALPGRTLRLPLSRCTLMLFKKTNLRIICLESFIKLSNCFFRLHSESASPWSGQLRNGLQFSPVLWESPDLPVLIFLVHAQHCGEAGSSQRPEAKLCWYVAKSSMMLLLLHDTSPIHWVEEQLEQLPERLFARHYFTQGHWSEPRECLSFGQNLLHIDWVRPYMASYYQTASLHKHLLCFGSGFLMPTSRKEPNLAVLIFRLWSHGWNREKSLRNTSFAYVTLTLDSKRAGNKF